MQSTEVLEFVKKDLEEFGSVVKNEASNVVSSTGAAIEKTFSVWFKQSNLIIITFLFFQLDSPSSTASSMKRSFSSFLGKHESKCPILACLIL